MGTLLEELKSWGCDVDGAMERFIDDEGLYRTCLDYDIVVRILEPLRAGSDENLLPVCDELMQSKKLLGKLIEAG